MSLLPKSKTYAGKLEIKGGSIAHHGKNTQHYATLLVDGYALHDIVVPERYDKMLQPGTDIELTLCAASLSMFILALSACIAIFAADSLEIGELGVAGVVVFFISTIYWLRSLIKSGHEIKSLKIISPARHPANEEAKPNQTPPPESRIFQASDINPELESIPPPRSV